MNHPTIQITSFEARHARYFGQLNKEWIQEYFALEPVDLYVLENPEAAILQNGGQIFFALLDEQVIGTVAIRKSGTDAVELTKMAVAKTARGQGAGRLLCQHAIAAARQSGAQKVVLYSNTRQAAAISLYRSLGFVECPLEPGIYERANIKMELPVTV